MKNLDLPLQSEGEHPSLQFEVVPALSTDPVSSDSMSYGLNLRKPESNPNPNPNPSVVVSSNRVDPTLVKLREDLSSLQEEAGPDDFLDIPVEAFSRAFLVGYGWTEGRGVGRNATEDVKVYEYKKRTAKEGLGFTGEIPQLPGKANQDDGRKKVGVENDKRGLGGGLAGYNGKEKGFYVGKDVRIVGGKEMGMKGRIVEVKRDSEVAVLRLLNSDKEVKADIRDLADLGSKEEERCLRKLKELERREMSNGFDKRSSRDNREKDKGATISREGSGGGGGRDRKKKESKRKREENKKNEYDKFSWLTSHIRVRIISKEIKGGRLYLKKGEVVDVVGPTCDVAIDESKELIQGVDQEQLETAIPKCGGRVLVLSGKHKGVYGSLVERDLEKETGVVQDADTHDMFKVRLEQIAEYIGDPSYLGY